MTPDEHAAKAERLAGEAAELIDGRGDKQGIANLIALAQVHATLATRSGRVEPILPEGPPTDAEMREAVLRHELAHGNDRPNNERILTHLVAVGQHIAYWDPARVLAEVEKNRRILALHYQAELESEPDHDPMGAGCAECGHFDWPCETIRVLALPYAQHPAFRAEWSIR